MTLTYGAWSFVVAVLVGVSLGIAAAVRHNTILDYLAVGVSIGAQVLPNFVLAPILTLVFTLWLGWLPGGGWQGGEWPYLVMPVIALSTSFMASIARITRSSMLEVLNTGFIRTARAKGLPRRRIVFHHALKPALVPVISYLGPAFVGMITGSVVIDVFFATGGIGQFFVNSALNRDYPGDHGGHHPRRGPDRPVQPRGRPPVRLDRPPHPVLSRVALLSGRRTIPEIDGSGNRRTARSLTPASGREPDRSAAPAGRSLWQDARRRFLRNRAAVASLVVLALVALFALFGDFVAAWSNEEIDWAMLGNVADEGAPSLANGHFFGVDELGRDLFARTVQGTRISLMVGIVGALISVVVGTLYGATAGYFGGRLDGVMMRIVDVLMAIPYMFVLILFMVVFGRSILMLFIGIGLISWLDMARIARGQTLGLKNREFVEAAVAIGVKPRRIILRHVVPNLLGVVIVYATLLVPSMIIYESFISFLGLGVQEPNTSWGALINAGASQMQYGTLWQLLFPLFFFVVTLFSFFFLGDGLRDALDPRDR